MLEKMAPPHGDLTSTDEEVEYCHSFEQILPNADNFSGKQR